MVNGYYIESKDFYINGFASYLMLQPDDEYTTQEINEMFKYYMYDFKNILVDLRHPFWKEIRNQALKKFYCLKGEL